MEILMLGLYTVNLEKVNNPIVTLKLVFTIALPCLLYAQEAMPMSKSYIKSLEYPWTRVFMKVFWTFSNDSLSFNIVNSSQGIYLSSIWYILENIIFCIPLIVIQIG